jgi:hypothetical protein
MFTMAFWKDAFERAIEIGAHALLGVLGANTTLLHLNWAQALDVALGAMVASLLASLATHPTPGSPAAAGPLLGAVRQRQRGQHEASTVPTTTPEN